MNDINKVILVGRCTRDPELKSTPQGKHLCRFSLASNESYTINGEKKESVNYVDCIIWGKAAEIISKYLTKGKRVAVDGKLKYSSWDNAEGKRQSKLEIMVDNFQFLDKADNPNQQGIGTSSSEEEAGFSFDDDPNIPF